MQAMYKTRRCRIDGCGKGGAYHFNMLCPFHWDELIEENIKKHIAAYKKEHQ
jgi:hypothetical protein